MNKDELFRHVATMGHKATNFPQPARPVNDMHREEFERWCERRGIATSPEHRTYEYQQAYEEWLAALRYRDEQEKQA